MSIKHENTFQFFQIFLKTRHKGLNVEKMTMSGYSVKMKDVCIQYNHLTTLTLWRVEDKAQEDGCLLLFDIIPLWVTPIH